MRYLVTLSAVLILAACSTTTATRSQSQVMSPTQVPASELQKASMEPPVQFLVAAAASDFHSHRASYPAAFRDVRAGHVMTAKGEKQYILCGQFLPDQATPDTEWTYFATVKTDPYEQWLGVQASSRCQQSSIAWDEEGDRSSSLQRQLDSLRK